MLRPICLNTKVTDSSALPENEYEANSSPLPESNYKANIVLHYQTMNTKLTDLALHYQTKNTKLTDVALHYQSGVNLICQANGIIPGLFLA